MAKKDQFCPFSGSGCKVKTDTETQTCIFWGDRKGCDLANAIASLKSIASLLKRLEMQLKQGGEVKHEG